MSYYIVEFETSNDDFGYGIAIGSTPYNAEDNFHEWWQKSGSNAAWGGLEYVTVIDQFVDCAIVNILEN